MENRLLCTNDNAQPQTVSLGFLNSHTDLRSPTTVTLLPETRGNDEAPQSVDSTWTFTLTFQRKLTSTCHRSNNTGREIPLEEGSSPPPPSSPAKQNTKRLPGKEPNTNFPNTNRRVKHLWRWSAHSKEQREGAFPSGQLPADVMIFKHTLVCKRHSHIVYL